MAAAAPRPANGATAKAIDPAMRALRPRPTANPTAAAGTISSPGNLAKTTPATQAASAMTAITTASATTWPATFSSASRARERDVVATNSRLPRRASPASVPDRARIDQSPARRAM